MNKLTVLCLLFGPCFAGAGQGQQETDTCCVTDQAAAETSASGLAGGLTLRKAIDLALRHNPKLDAYAWDIRAADAGVLQAGRRPNPELSVEVEDVRLSAGPIEESRTRSLSATPGTETVSLPAFGGEGANEVNLPRLLPAFDAGKERMDGIPSGLAGSEMTISLTQIIELGGKRAKRIALARMERQRALWDYETTRADVIAETACAFVAVLAAGEKLSVQHRSCELAEEMVRATQLQIAAGKASPLDGSRAEVALSGVRIALDATHRELNVARSRLAASWGSPEACAEHVAGDLNETPELPPLDDLFARIGRNPEIARWVSEMAYRDADTDLARAQRIPDPAIQIGFRTTGLPDRAVSRYGLDSEGGLSLSQTAVRSRPGRDNSLVLGLSVALPVFDRNQGNIARGNAMAAKTSAERQSAELTVHTRLIEAYEAAAGARAQLDTLRQEVIPKSTSILERTKEGYRQGKFGYLDVLDAQRVLSEAELDHVDAMRRFHEAYAGLERLTGDALGRWEMPEGISYLEKTNDD